MGEPKPEAIKFMSIVDQDNVKSFEEMKEHAIERAREVVDELLPHTGKLAEITRKQDLSCFLEKRLLAMNRGSEQRVPLSCMRDQFLWTSGS